MPSGSTWNAWRLLRGSIARVLQGPPAERGLPAARGSIRLLGSTWNFSPGLPQPGRGLSTVNGPRSLGKNSLSDDLRGADSALALPPRGRLTTEEIMAMPMRPFSEALGLAAAAVLFAVTASARRQAATGAQVSGQQAAAADRSSGERPRQRGRRAAR